MKLLKRLLFLVLGLLLLVLLFSFIMPKKMNTEREVIINKPVSEVYDFIKYTGNMDKVSVWMQKDPNMKKTFTGTDGTVGFISRWESDHKEVGIGEQEITKLVPNKRVESALRFEKPFESKADAYLAIEDAGNNQTKVKWGFASESKPPMNLMNGMIIKDLNKAFDEGLANLKKELE